MARKPLVSRRWRYAAGAVLAATVLGMGGHSGAGHSVGHYPSYYPDEIRIAMVDPEAAAAGLVDRTLHAYVGSAPRLRQPVPAHIKSVKSLGSVLVLSVNGASGRFASAENRCAAARGVLAALAEEKTGGLVFHPYPVTPYHADYLHHIDRVAAARDAVAAASPSSPPQPVGAEGALAASVVQARFGAVAPGADMVLEAVDVGEFVAAGSGLWVGPPWIKDGWFHAYRLLEPGLDAAERPAVEDAYERLVRGDLRGGGLATHADLERSLVAGLTVGCRRLVVGYVPREEHFNEAYPPGVENIGYDAIAGLNSPIFIRTAKLKEYPWNGKLHLGVGDPPGAAWNPVAGFTDSLGRLMWSAVGDPAMIPFPVNSGWMPNRVQSTLTKVEGVSGGVKLPADALLPEPGSGALQRVGERAFASQKVTYEVVVSPYDDGTEQSVADVLYPFSFIYRWGAKAKSAAGVGTGPREPSLAPAYATLDERLAGVKVVRVDRTKHTIAEGLEIVVNTPVVEVYLTAAPGDETQVAALAPPWSTVPWHLLALMEEAVDRGYAAFSAAEARRLGIPWLDLVRDPVLLGKLRLLIVQFERNGHRPAALKELVTADEARERWRSLKAYAEKTGHLLVANGPYRLKSWTPGSVALEAVREMTYPLGLGTYDRFVHPPRAVIEEAAVSDSGIVVRASAEMTLKGGRGTTSVKEPLKRTTARGTYPLLVVSRYLLIDPAGKVLKLDKMQWREDGGFVIDLPQRLPPGDYTAITGVFLDGNATQPSTRTLHIRRIGASGAPG